VVGGFVVTAPPLAPELRLLDAVQVKDAGFMENPELPVTTERVNQEVRALAAAGGFILAADRTGGFSVVSVVP
jgi:hypothetical protein